MARHFVRFRQGARTAWGLIRDRSITVLPGAYETTGDFVAAATSTLDLTGGPTVDRRSVELLSPVTSNQRFVCLGPNYRDRVPTPPSNRGNDVRSTLFAKASSCIVAAGSDIIRPWAVRLLDYGVTLGLVLRNAITRPICVTETTLLDHIAGLVLVNDFSARDVELTESSPYHGRSFRTFGSVGPYLCLLGREDLPKLRQLRLMLRVNGKMRQDDSTENWILGPAEALSELSSVQDLATGDLVTTGTPAGNALTEPAAHLASLSRLLPEGLRQRLLLGLQARRPYLQPGDLVHAGIRTADGSIDLGIQRNRIVAGP